MPCARIRGPAVAKAMADTAGVRSQHIHMGNPGYGILAFCGALLARRAILHTYTSLALHGLAPGRDNRRRSKMNTMKS